MAASAQDQDNCGAPVCRVRPFCEFHFNKAMQECNDAPAGSSKAPPASAAGGGVIRRSKSKAPPASTAGGGVCRTKSVRGKSDTRGQRARLWCFTLNHYTELDISRLHALTETGTASYLVYGREVVPGNGTPHLQGFVRFTRALRLQDVLAVSPIAHYEVTRGSPVQAADYCKKDGDFVEIGELPAGPAGRAKRDYAQIVTACKAGDLDSLDPEVLFLHYGTAKRIKADFARAPPNLDDVCGIWYQGPPGSGKSYKARQACPAQDLYLKPANKWWDSYCGQDFVLIDDFDTNHKCLGHHLKIWADRYAFAAEQKGSTIQIRPKTIIITSNYSIAEIFGDDLALTTAIKRRFKIFTVVDRQAVLQDGL